VREGYRGLRGLLLGGGNVGENAHDVALLHDQEVLAVELDLGARPFAEQHAVADLEVNRDQLATFVTAARADRGDFALRGLFLGGVRNDDAAPGLCFGVDTLDHDTVMQRTKFRFSHDGSFWRLGFQVWVCDRKRTGIRAYSTPPRGKTARILSNRALGVLIVRPEYGLIAILSTKGGLSPWWGR